MWSASGDTSASRSRKPSLRGRNLRLRLGKLELEAPAVCGSVIGESLGSMRNGLRKATEQGADLVELRIDGMRDRTGWQELLKTGLPAIVTNRPEREGGRFKGDEGGRIGSLLEGIDGGAACVDVELSTEKALLGRVLSNARKRGASVLMSYHNLTSTPKADELIEEVKKMVLAGCDIAKVVTFAEDRVDALRVLDFLVRVQDETRVPVIAFAMGDAGRISRIAAPLLGSPIVYAAAGEVTAPGQLDVATTKMLLRKFLGG